MSYASEVLADGPVAWYRCSEAFGQLQDSSGQANHTTGTVGAGSCTYQQTSPIVSDTADRAIRLNADFAFTAPDHGSLDVGDVFTLEAWVKLTSLSASEGYVVSKSENGYALNVEATGVAAGIKLVRPASSVIVISDFTIFDTEWHHVAITKNGATVVQYIDAVDVTGVVTNDTITNNTESLYIGERGPGDTYFNHFLDEVAVYPTALSQARVQAHFEAAQFLPSQGRRRYRRLYGPAQLGTSAADLYTVPEGTRTRVRRIYANNPTGSPVTVTVRVT